MDADAAGVGLRIEDGRSQQGEKQNAVHAGSIPKRGQTHFLKCV
jgi:hypothetical protein